MASFEENFENLEDWVKNFQSLLQQFPDIYRVYEISKINKEVLDSFPVIGQYTTEKNLNDGLETLVPFLPQIGTINPMIIQNSMLSSLSGATASMADVQSFVPTNSQEQVWKYESRVRYNSFFEKINNTEDILDYFLQINAHKLVDELRSVLNEFELYQSNRNDHMGFAIKLRTFLEHFYGLLKQSGDLIRYNGHTSSREISWPKLANLIAKGKVTSIENKEFQRMGRVWDSIHSYLSQEAKVFTIVDFDDLTACHINSISMVLTFIRSIDIEKIKRGVLYNNYF